jgi:hypothetical protein
LIILDVEQSRLYKFLKFPFQYLSAIFRHPYSMILMVICPMRTVSYVHGTSIS